MKRLFLTFLLLPLFTICAQDADKADKGNQPDQAAVEAYMAELKAIESKFQYQTGEITLEGGIATIKVPENFRFLGPKDASTVLTELWGNPEGDDNLGMLLPAGVSPLDEESWAVVISYSDDGYVKDSDADKINYTKMLKEMQEDARDANAERRKFGYSEVELVGWAAPPHYDKATHKMYWAKELKFSGADENTLNYDIRVLGRRGVLVLSAVASMSQFSLIEKHTPEIVAMVDFTEGNRYADFNDKTDKVAAYGLAALVAGSVASKAGFFKAIWLAIVAGKKFVILGVIGLFALIKKFFGNKESAS